MPAHWSTAVFLIALSCAACSSEPPREQLPAGAVSAGSAKVAIDAREAPTVGTVDCQSLGGTTMITIGDSSAGVKVALDNTSGIATKSVAINDIGGFTGSYQEDLQGTVRTRMIGETYEIDGTADGFATDNPSFRATRNFTVRVAC